MALLLHPDKNPSEKAPVAFKRVQDAWDALSGSEQPKLLSTKCYLKENFEKWQSTRQEAAAPLKAATKREIRQRKKGAPAFVSGRECRGDSYGALFAPLAPDGAPVAA